MLPALKKISKWTGSLLFILALILSAGLFTMRLQHLRPAVDRSGSMSPALQGGDLLLLSDAKPQQIRSGQIVAFLSPGNETIVHRVIWKKSIPGGWRFHTKGDANDRGETWNISPDGKMGVLRRSLPLLGGGLQPLTELSGQRMLGIILAGLAALLALLQLTVRALDRRNQEARG